MLIAPATFRRLVRARSLLECNGAPSVRVVAKTVRISEFHFIRQFSALFGETPGRFRTRARVERAKRLLAARQSVTAVCLEVGFSSLGSFSARFSREVGVSPSRYEPATLVHHCVDMLAAISEKRAAP